MSEEWISKEDAMRLTGLSYHGMYPYVKRGELVSRKAPNPAGGAVQYSRSHIDTFLEARNAVRYCTASQCTRQLTHAQKKYCSNRCMELARPYRYSPEYGRMHYLRTKEQAIQRSTAWIQAHPERATAHFRRSLLKTRYGITIAQFAALEVDSEGVCWICCQPQKEIRKNGKLRNLVVDHDHAHTAGDPAGVRGLLCTSCNVRLKAFEDALWYSSAVAYLADAAALVIPAFPGERRGANRGAQYGLSPSQVAWLEKRCADKCELCDHVPSGVKNNRLNIDHDHNKSRGEPGHIRGMVCSHCNTKLGILDDTVFASAARRYLEHSPGRAQSLLAQALAGQVV